MGGVVNRSPIPMAIPGIEIEEGQILIVSRAVLPGDVTDKAVSSPDVRHWNQAPKTIRHTGRGSSRQIANCPGR